ncbi:MAG TPA: ribulose-phosphate 3-epimerase [Spirochaetia bacterium]
MSAVKIAPSMMCADFIHLGDELDVMKANGIEYLHIDIMDGHYVPNLTLGPDYCRALVAYSPIPLDIHLMIEDVGAYVPHFAKFPGAVVSFHPEVDYHPLRTIELIKSLGARAGIAIEPAMPLDTVREILPHVSLACVMTVSPGYAGQKIIPEALEKVRLLSALVERNGWDMEIEVDGNVSWENIPKIIEAGGNVLVAGTSSLFQKGARLSETIPRLRALIEKVA